MANNRMAIVCKECKVGVAIAKFYPDTGWYTVSQRDEKLNKFFEDHAHDNDKSTFGGDQYELGYEMDGKDWTYA